MAGRVKPGSGKPKAKKRGSNLPLDPEEAAEAMAGIFAAKEKLKRDTGKLRKAIGDEIATAASRLEVSQKKVKLLIKKKELADAEDAEFAEMHGADKAELEKLAAMFGAESPFGRYAKEAAEKIDDDDQFAAGEGGGEGPEED